MGRLHRKIKCPRHYLLKPGGTPFVMERKPTLKNIKVADCWKFGVDPFRPKIVNGRKVQNFKDYYQPDVSAAEMKLRLWNPLNPICNQCKRCVTA